MTGGVVLSAFLAATPTPSPTTTTPAVDADLVTPGLWGFVTLFVLAVAVYFLGRSMARRVQRMNQRARLQEQEAAERRAAEDAAAHPAGASAADGPDIGAPVPDEDPRPAPTDRP